MSRACFITGAEDSRDRPSDTPEAFWRVYLPGLALGKAAILGHPGSAERALAAQVLWIYEPTCAAAASLAEVARHRGKPVVVDFAEDPWARPDIDNAYNDARMEALEQTLAVATMIAVATPALLGTFAPYGQVRLVQSVIPLGDWTPKEPKTPPALGWWCDHRQRGGMEEVAPGLRQVLGCTSVRMAHIGFAHQAPVMRGLIDKAAIADRAHRLSSFYADDLHLSVEANMRIFREALGNSYLSLECYPSGSYRGSVSDIPLLRAAALGVPSITTRSEAPPGAISAGPEEWAETIIGVLEDPGFRRGLSLEARAWAETRTSNEAYKAVLEEVDPS